MARDANTPEANQYILGLCREEFIDLAGRLYQDPSQYYSPERNTVIDGYIEAFKSVADDIQPADDDLRDVIGQDEVDRILDKKVERYIEEYNFMADAINKTTGAQTLTRVPEEAIEVVFDLDGYEISPDDASEATSGMAIQLFEQALDDGVKALTGATPMKDWPTILRRGAGKVLLKFVVRLLILARQPSARQLVYRQPFLSSSGLKSASLQRPNPLLPKTKTPHQLLSF